jgi:hypothetical protein
VKGGVQLKSSHDNSYPQKLYTGVKTLWDTPNAMREVIKQLTHGIRFLREKRTAYAVSSLKRRKRLWASIAILAVTSTTGIHNANSVDYSKDQLKLYAHSAGFLIGKNSSVSTKSLQRKAVGHTLPVTIRIMDWVKCDRPGIGT